jgi:DNA (cytosine-5)-methyltransferase 1
LIDNAEDCIETCRLNHPDCDVVMDDVSTYNWEGVSANIVVGGPPCQGFSTLGPRDEDDPRNRLFRALLRCVDEVDAHVVVVENVPRFLKSPQGDGLIRELRYLGYNVRAEIVDCATYGVPQARKRTLVIASRRGLPTPWPEAEFGLGLLPVRTVADALALLPAIPDGRNWHRPLNLSETYNERIRSIPSGGSRRDLPADLVLDCWRTARGHSDVMGRMRWTQPATTIRTEFFRPEKGRFLHPTEDRPITVREGARLQGFPDSFRFPETLPTYPVARQIGNAIPPPVAKAIGVSVSRATGVESGASAGPVV